MLPQFNTLGVLPPTPDQSPYACDRSEAEQRFVSDFGSPNWRRTLFDGWDLLRTSIAIIAPSARWWIWGSLVTNRVEPLFGDLATADAVVLIPAKQLPDEAGQRALLMASVRTAEQYHRVDVHAPVFEFELSDSRRAATDAAMLKLRRRASRSIVDDSTMAQIDSGFIEILP
jgi:hypothetical protein